MSGKNKPTPEFYGELQRAFNHFNEKLFEGVLPDCLITLQRKANTMGYFALKRFVNEKKEFIDEIALNPVYFSLSIKTTMQTIVHEMAHLWQYHFGNPSINRYHNTEWAEKMKSIGLIPSSTGAPGGRETGQKMSDYASEDGLFINAYEQLINDDFQLIWVDKYIPLSRSIQYILNANNVKTTISGEILSENNPTVKYPVQLVAEKKDTSKTKYSCPSCGISVWGKLGLNIQCNDCDCGLETNDQERG